ncbi:MAG: hypothetical protein ACOX2M_03610 [Fastidiosipilaceae bacterium]
MARQNLDETKMMKVLLSQIKALRDTIEDIINNSQANETWRYVSYKHMACIYNDLAEQTRTLLKVPSMFYTFNTNEIPGLEDTTWPRQKQVLEKVLLTTKLLYSCMEGSLDFASDEFDNLESFIKSRLRTVVFERPQKEVDVQNAIESLLIGRNFNKGTDYDRETGKFKFSGKEYIPDFIIPKLQLCVEVKLLREGRKSKVIEEISADITAYAKQYERQLFIVYDLGYIQNEEEFRRDIESVDNVKVVIIKH